MLTTTCMLAALRQQQSYGESGYHRFGGPEPVRRIIPAHERPKKPRRGAQIRAWDEVRGEFVYTTAE